MSDVSDLDLDTEVEEPVNAEECIAEANALRSSGNDAFKALKYDEASSLYERAIKCLDKIPNKSQPQKGLQSIIYSNLSATYYANGDGQQAVRYASLAITNDPKNNKAYYRRSQASFKIGNLEQAKEDCVFLLNEDKNNADVRGLLNRINEKIKQVHKDQKKVFGGLFNRGGALYDDRVKEAELKAKAAAENCEIKSDDEDSEHEKPTEPETNVPPLKESKPVPPIPPPVSRSRKYDHSLELDEEDEKIVSQVKKMGYCYFNRPDDASSSSNVSSTPKRVDVTSTSDELNNKKSISSWNAQGTTYEEKDTTRWCKNLLEESLLATTFELDTSKSDQMELLVGILEKSFKLHSYGAHAQEAKTLASGVTKATVAVNSVSRLEGDAHIACVRGSKRYMFDFSAQLELRINVEGAPQCGVERCIADLSLEDISSANESGKTWQDFMSVVYRDELEPNKARLVTALVDHFCTLASGQISSFIDQYQRL